MDHVGLFHPLELLKEPTSSRQANSSPSLNNSLLIVPLKPQVLATWAAVVDGSTKLSSTGNNSRPKLKRHIPTKEEMEHANTPLPKPLALRHQATRT